MKLKTGKICFYPRAFTLVEVLAALTVGAMVLIVVLALYNRGQSGAAAVIGKLDSSRLPREILQRIAEDLDRVVVAGQGTQIDIQNKLQDGFQVAKMEIFVGINDAKDQPQTLEKIVWQSSVDRDSGLLTLYRSHSGIALEDALLDNQKEPWQRELFVPICSGLTFFKIEIPKGETPLDRWTGEVLPPAIKIILSFALPYKTVTGTFDVPEEDKLVRIIAVDRTRMLPFNITMTDVNQSSDANSPDANKPADANSPIDTNSPIAPAARPQSGQRSGR
jgi:prepilin-type N-terminal cleavage/methylation domain-containing protein